MHGWSCSQPLICSDTALDRICSYPYSTLCLNARCVEELGGMAVSNERCAIRNNDNCSLIATKIWKRSRRDKEILEAAYYASRITSKLNRLLMLGQWDSIHFGGPYVGWNTRWFVLCTKITARGMVKFCACLAKTPVPIQPSWALRHGEQDPRVSNM